MRSPSPEPTDPQGPEQGMSNATAYILAEGANWLATGRVDHDLDKPMGRLLARMDEVIPTDRHLEWLTEPSEGLDGKRPMDFVDADDLEPLERLLDDIGGPPESAALSRAASPDSAQNTPAARAG